jgi:HD superfamily phosphohydrolase
MKDFPGTFQIKDPIHGYVSLTELEKSLIDLRISQRLREIKTPAGAHMVFPGLYNSSMGRMIGFLHVTEVFMDYLGGNIDEILRARLVALFLSLATGPWSNVSNEYFTTRGIDRVKLAQLIVESDSVEKILSSSDYSKDDVASLLKRGIQLKGVRFPLHSVSINPELVDRLERDSYFAGVEYAQMEYRRLFTSTRIAKNKIAVERGSLYTLESYLSAGLNMFEAVYYHKTTRAADLMLLRILDLAGSQLMTLPTENMDDFQNFDDLSFMDALLHVTPESTEEMRAAGKIFSEYTQRYLIKLAGERAISDDAFLKKIATPDGLYKVEEEIAETAGIDPGSVYVDYPNRLSVCYYPGKIPLEDLVLFERGSGGYEFWPVRDVSLIARSIDRQLKLIRVYTTRGYRPKVKKAAEALLESIDVPGSKG